MRLTVQRGELRRVLTQIQPHMGQPSKTTDGMDYHPYGRLRAAIDPSNRIVVWAGDEDTRACASLDVVQYIEDDLPVFDLSTEDVTLILKAFRPVGDANQRTMWNSGLFDVRILEERLVITELHSFGLEGKSLALPLTFKPGAPADTYPDFPSSIINVLTAPLEPCIEAYPKRESMFRILSAVHPYGHIRIIESSRNALIVGGTAEFTAIVPCQVVRPETSRVTAPPDSFSEISAMLLPYVQPIDETNEAGKTRAAITRGLDLATEKDPA